jgi:cell division septation protein DedD
MRIDYSEPKKSYVTPQGGNRPRKEPTGYFTTILIVTGVITFVAGFGTGWFLSQKSAKKSFQAATAQTSLENSPKKEVVAPPVAPQPVQPPTATPQNAQTPGQPPASASTASETPLSFYKALPSGQKNTVLGSGINTKEEHNKAPLQAPVPANLNNPAPADPTKPPTAKPTTSDKTAAQQGNSNGFTVQVASYPLKSEAETQKIKLVAKGYHVFIIESNQGDKGTWYRVRVGRKLDHDAAKELSAKLGKSALVIPDKD